MIVAFQKKAENLIPQRKLAKETKEKILLCYVMQNLHSKPKSRLKKCCSKNQEQLIAAKLYMYLQCFSNLFEFQMVIFG